MKIDTGKVLYFFIRILLFFALIFQYHREILAQENGKINLLSEKFQDANGTRLSGEWKYRPGNNKEWASTDIDDSAWERCRTGLGRNNMPKSGFPGMGWFRVRLTLDSILLNKIMVFSLYQSGKSEVYLDGKLIKEVEIKDGAQVNGGTNWSEMIFREKREYLIAVYFENHSVEKFHTAGFAAGFYFRLQPSEKAVISGMNNERENTISQILFSSLPLAFALLHFILFIYSPRKKANLYYAFALIFYAAATYLDYQSGSFSTNIEQNLIYMRMHRIANPLANIFFLRFIYAVFYEKLPGQFWVFIAVILASATLACIKPGENYPQYTIVSLFVSIEVGRNLVLFMKRKYDGAVILASGFFTLFIFSTYDTLLDLNIMNPINNIQNMYFWGSLGLFIATTIYLARDFTRTGKKLIEQERLNKEKEFEKRLLEKDNLRKTKELEDARNLQISMLPKDVPQIPGLEIAVYMKTATEVGGDYYDFFRLNEKDIIIAVGDATGHGTKSGNMVSIIKSLLSASKVRNNFTSHFMEWSKIIKQMNLGNLFMGLTLVRINENKLIFSSAGMPPIYVLNSDSHSIDEIVIKSMPLGAAIGFPYKEIERTLLPNDIIILMSDGYLEQFNEKMEMLETNVFKEYLLEISDKSPENIIKYLMEKSKEWMNDKPQTDDITFVVVKVG